MESYDEQREQFATLLGGSDGEVVSDLAASAERDQEAIYKINAEMLQDKWQLDGGSEMVREALAAIAATLRSLLLHSDGGIEALGRIEAIDANPYFEVTAGATSVLGVHGGLDPRVQVPGAEISRDLALRLAISPEIALQIWRDAGRACRTWAETPHATPLLPGLHLRVANQAVEVTLVQADDLGLG